MTVTIDLGEPLTDSVEESLKASKGWFDRLAESIPFVKKILNFSEEIVEKRRQGSAFEAPTGPAGPEKVSLDAREGIFSFSAGSDLAKQLAEIDRKLVADFHSSSLWLRRSSVNQKLDHGLEAYVDELTAYIVKGDTRTFFRTSLFFAHSKPEFGSLGESGISEVSKGRLLAKIREERVPAEVNYSLLLTFGGRFGDEHIFRQGIDSMRTGYAGEKRGFLGGSGGSDGKPGDNSIGLLGEGEFALIQRNTNKFLERIGSTAHLVPILRAQFRLLLTTHLNEDLAVRLVSQVKIAWKYKLVEKKLRDLSSWPELPSDANLLDSTRRWFKVLTMEKLKELSLTELFTGFLYRPGILFERNTTAGIAEIESIPWMAGLTTFEVPEVSDGRPLAQAIYKRYLGGFSDWADYLRQGQGAGIPLHTKARCQRVLLFLVTEFGPLGDFERFFEPPTLVIDWSRKFDLHGLTYFCDSYRLSLAFSKRVDEQRLFDILLAMLPQPPNGWTDFRDAAEQIVLCLFLNGTPMRRFKLDEMLVRTITWLKYAAEHEEEEMFDELLSFFSYLEAGVLTDLVPERVERHNFNERRRALWIEHARSLAIAGDEGWAKWKQDCRSQNEMIDRITR